MPISDTEFDDDAGADSASAIGTTPVGEALNQLVAEGMIAKKEVETGDGTTTYYRLNTDEPRE